MPRRPDLETICVVGAGPIVIGQACEFDYSGSQALKVLRAEGYRTVVVNSNPATIMTDPGFADRTYLEPLDLEGVAGVLERERPDALLPTLGGQTALNLAASLAEEGVLGELGVELIGAGLDAIRRAEDRELFRATMDSVGLRPAWVHAANSAATATRSGAHFDLVRLGVAVYGLHPSAVCKLPDGCRPALSWKARLVQVRRLPPDRGVSYGHVYRTQAEERVGTALVGYADGFRREPGNLALVGGRRVPVIGRVCMDMCVLQLDQVPEARPGDEVVLIGSQAEESIRAEEVAERWGTINYEVTCGIGARVPRVYA